MEFDARTVRSNLRLGSALDRLMTPWRTDAGTALLAAAALVHYANALWSIYARRSLHLARWEWAQLGLGLCIPILLIHHVVSTRVALTLTGFDAGYATVLLLQWVLMPWLAALQGVAVLVVWLHAAIGIHFW